MDQRLKEIVDSFEKMKIGLDDTFRFGCDQCGKCCIHREDIMLTPRDLYNLAAELRMSISEVIRQYCECYIGQDSNLPIIRLKPKGSVHRCPLLKDQKCSVHQAKPTVCAMYPIGRCIIKSKGTYKPDSMSFEDVQYIINPIDCGDKSQTHTVREWLERFGIPLEDPFFLQWQKTIATLSVKLHELRKNLSDSCMEIVWNVIYSSLYLDYDPEQPLGPQFKANSEKLMDAMEHMPVLECGTDEG